MRSRVQAAALLVPVLLVPALLTALGLTLRADATVPARRASTPWRLRSPRSVWDSVYTEEQAKRGEALYTATCAECHKATLVGADDALPLAGDAFLSGWNGLTVGAFFSKIESSMPSNDPGSLNRQQIADIVAYVLQYNKFPPGKQELGTDAESLKEIKIEATKP